MVSQNLDPFLLYHFLTWFYYPGYYYTGIAFPQAEVELDDFLDTLDLAHFVEDDAFLTSAQRQIIDSGRIQELVDPRFLDYGMSPLTTFTGIVAHVS